MDTISMNYKKVKYRTIVVSRSGNCQNGDVNNQDFVQKIIKTEKPDFILNFAANSMTRHEVLLENHNTEE